MCYLWAMSIRRLAHHDIDPLAEVLKRAFAADPELRWVIPDPAEWDRIADPWFRMHLSESLRQGHGLTDNERRGVSLWEPPGTEHSFLSRLVALWRMALMFRGNLARAIEIQRAMEDYRPGGDFWYLTYIATHPRHQGTGLGGALLRPMLELAERSRTPVFLECSNERNVPFYETHGFKTLARVPIRGGPTIWPMLREAG